MNKHCDRYWFNLMVAPELPHDSLVERRAPSALSRETSFLPLFLNLLILFS